jgi:hypothetical protein
MLKEISSGVYLYKRYRYSFVQSSLFLYFLKLNAYVFLLFVWKNFMHYNILHTVVLLISCYR